jgi:hypothetical protein
VTSDEQFGQKNLFREEKEEHGFSPPLGHNFKWGKKKKISLYYLIFFPRAHLKQKESLAHRKCNLKAKKRQQTTK